MLGWTKKKAQVIQRAVGILMETHMCAIGALGNGP